MAEGQRHVARTAVEYRPTVKHWAWVVLVAAAIGCNKRSRPSSEPSAPPHGSAEVQGDAAAVAAVAAPDAAPDSAATPDATPPEPPQARARALLAQQLEALPSDDEAMARMFTKDAVVLVPVAWPLDGMTIYDPSINLAEAVARMTPHATLQRKKLTKVTAGGNAAMVWLSAELDVATTAGEHGEPKPIKKQRVVRVLELLDAASSWKVVAASFGDVRPLEESIFSPVPAQTPAGPLSKLLVAPHEVAASLADDPAVVVQGTDKAEYAVGPAAAKTLLAKWSKLKLEINKDSGVHEVRGKHWGYAVANVGYTKGDISYAMSALIIAVPSGDAWSVVALHYLPL